MTRILNKSPKSPFKKKEDALSTEEFNKHHPFQAKLKERVLLSRPGSTKKTYHLQLDLAKSGIQYAPGDAFAIFPENPFEMVQALLTVLKKTGDEAVVNPRSKHSLPLRTFLLKKANLMRLPSSFFTHYSDLNKSEYNSLKESHDWESFLCQYGVPSLPIQELISFFSPLLPRFYSIASSSLIANETVDLLVVTFKRQTAGKMRQGLGSQFLCERAEIEKTPIPIYLQPNPSFKLPTNPKTPIIMIGPGTGVAPFRAFLKERLHQNAPGKNWLFFGEREKAYDFYYEDFFIDLEKKGFLKLDTAFSRDQKEKIYVQNRLLENANEVWQWMKEGAVLYICGDAQCMAKDVTATLQSIIQEKGNLSEGESKAFLRSLRKEKRLLLDVY